MTKRSSAGSGCTGVHGDKFEESQEIQKSAKDSKECRFVVKYIFWGGMLIFPGRGVALGRGGCP